MDKLSWILSKFWTSNFTDFRALQFQIIIIFPKNKIPVHPCPQKFLNIFFHAKINNSFLAVIHFVLFFGANIFIHSRIAHKILIKTIRKYISKRRTTRIRVCSYIYFSIIIKIYDSSNMWIVKVSELHQQNHSLCHLPKLLVFPGWASNILRINIFVIYIHTHIHYTYIHRRIHILIKSIDFELLEFLRHTSTIYINSKWKLVTQFWCCIYIYIRDSVSLLNNFPAYWHLRVWRKQARKTLSK